jgi:hypothetical protein
LIDDFAAAADNNNPMTIAKAVMDTSQVKEIRTTVSPESIYFYFTSLHKLIKSSNEMWWEAFLTRFEGASTVLFSMH